MVIGGLFQQEEDTAEKRLPFLGKIPLVGNFFKNRQDTAAESEFIIYLVPFVEKSGGSVPDEKENLERLMKKYQGAMQ